MCCGIIASCFTLCCMHCCCSAIQECNGKRGPASRIPYIFIMFVACIFSAIMTLYGEKKLYSNDTLHASLKVCNSSSCEGNGVAYRTSFILLVFFLIHAIVVYFIMAFHWSFFTTKVLLLVGFIIASFWCPNDFFQGYAEFARIASIFFLVLQVLVLVVWAWDVSDLVLAKIELLEKGEPHQNDEKGQNNNKCQIFGYQSLLIATTLGLQAFCVILWWLMFEWFGNSGCALNQTLISLTIVAVIFLNALSIYAERGSLFVASIVSSYGTYLCYAALQSNPDASCNQFPGEKNTLSLWIGIVITAAALSYAGFSVSSSTSQALVGRHSVDETSEERDMKPKDQDKQDATTTTTTNDLEGKNDSAEKERLGASNYDDLEDNQKVSKSEKQMNKHSISDDDKIERNRNVVFHICMALAAIYYAMLYTNWSTDSGNKDTRNGRGDISLAINISAEWLSFGLYLWTLCAPKLFPNRVFD